MLDLNIRRYMQTEYGLAEPPHGVFGKVLAAIRSNSAAATSIRIRLEHRLGKLASAFYNALTRPSAASRLVPGLVAFGFVIAVLTSNSHNLLFNINSLGSSNSSTYNHSFEFDPHDLVATKLAEQAAKDQATIRGNVPEGLSQFYPPANVAFYHPVERHLAPKLHTNTSSDTNKQETDTDYFLVTNGAGY